MRFNIKNKKEHEIQPAAEAKGNRIAMEDNRTSSIAQLKMDAVIANNKIIQRKIIHNGIAFGHNDKRPTWRRNLKSWTAFVYNLHHNLLGQPGALNTSTNIGNLNLARTHKVPFHQMQRILENYCNGLETYANLQIFCRLIIKQTSPAYATMVGLLNNLNGAVNANPMNRPAVLLAANRLLSELHNSIDNILIGHSGMNSGIGERGDWNFGLTPGGTGRMTPISSESYHALSNTLPHYDPGLYRPAGPGGQIASSHVMSSTPAAFHPHNPLIRWFTTKHWRGPGYYQNGVLGVAGNFIHPANNYFVQPP